MKIISYKQLIINLFIIFIIVKTLPAQEALKSAEEEYYDFLALQGITDRPTLNYRTLSDSAWNIKNDADHVWDGQNLGRWFNLFGDFRMRVYGPELFMSGNTAAPYGQNDGVLWQGRGFNALFKSGVRFEGYGIELTLMPYLAFSQNAEFEYIDPNYSGTDFAKKAQIYGYYGLQSVDAPQRFGDKPFFDWDFGDSEFRYTWRTLTIGFGTQPLWLGPAQLNPIIHSNNASSYPKLDIGLRRQPMIIPWVKWYIGDIEFRAWWGYLSESDWFNNTDCDDHNLITGVSITYGFPYFLKGLSIGLNRIMLSKWDEMNYASVFTLMLPFIYTSPGKDNSDQRLSIIIDYLLPVIGLNVYFEWGRNDYSPNVSYIVRYLFHTQGYTLGIKKSLAFSSFVIGEILLEITGLECSQDYDRVIPWSSTFYAHHQITQGHTNRGQWLGAGIGTGGNSQYLGFKLYFPKGYGSIFVQRRNPDLDYTWFIDSKKSNSSDLNVAENNIRAFIDFGLSGIFYFLPGLSVYSSMVFRDEHNPLNQSIPDTTKSERRFNFYIAASVKYTF